MSDEPTQRPQGTHTSKRPVSHSGNNAAKWLIGAAAAALLLGGGYYAFKNASPSQPSSEVADNTAIFAAPTQSEAGANGATAANGATTEENVATTDTSAGATSDTATVKPKPAKTRVAAAIPEETIGVSRGATSASNSDEVVVNPLHRPVWRYTPRPERLAAYYPEGALERGREGEASLHCIIQKKGA